MCFQGSRLAEVFQDGIVLLDWGPSPDGDAIVHADETAQALRWLSILQQQSQGLCMQLQLRFSTDKEQVCMLLSSRCSRSSDCLLLAPVQEANFNRGFRQLN